MHITRRGFFKALALLTLPTTGSAHTPPSYVLNRFYIAGLQYYDGPQILKHMRPGDALTLTAEPENIHDYYAVLIHGYGHKLGYVPRTDNRHISRLLRQNAPVSCRISAVRPEEPTWQAVRVEVGLG
ncbi:hypothetical protein MASR1M90_15680 [Desulfovibrionales bacterium]